MKFLGLGLIIAAALTAPSCFSQVAYTDGVISLAPLGYWKLDGNFNDSTVHQATGLNGNAATPIGFTLVGGGAPVDLGGQAAVFNSSSVQYVTIPSVSALNFNFFQPFTIAAWVKTANQGLATMTVVAKIDGTQTGYALVINNRPPSGPLGGGRFALRVQSQGAVSEVASAVPVNDGAWHFLVATSDGSGFLTESTCISTAPRWRATSTRTACPDPSWALPPPPSERFPPPAHRCLLRLIDEVAVFGSAYAATDSTTGRLCDRSPQVLPQFVFGGGWYSAIYFSNTGPAAVTFPVTSDG